MGKIPPMDTRIYKSVDERPKMPRYPVVVQGKVIGTLNSRMLGEAPTRFDPDTPTPAHFAFTVDLKSGLELPQSLACSKWPIRGGNGEGIGWAFNLQNEDQVAQVRKINEWIGIEGPLPTFQQWMDATMSELSTKGMFRPDPLALPTVGRRGQA